MRILHISDTHGKHHLLKNLPEADVIIHSGDVSFSDTENEVLEFLTWFFDLDYLHKIFVAGNHDDCLYGRQIKNLPNNCYYLCYSGVEIEGVKFWGVPLFTSDHKRIEPLMKQIPENIGVLISHSPPYGILDFENEINNGSIDLLQTVLKIKPTYHLFGHIHKAYGIEKSNDTIFVNASLVNEKNDIVNKPVLVLMSSPFQETRPHIPEGFSNCVKNVIALSKEEAFRLGHDAVDAEHLILGIISEGEGVAVMLLKKLGVPLEQLRGEIEKESKKITVHKIRNVTGIPLSRTSEKVLKISYLEAKIFKAQLIGTEHLLLSILRGPDNLATQILIKFNVTYDVVKERLEDMSM